MEVVVLFNLTMNTGSHHQNTSRNLLMTSLYFYNLLIKMSFYKLQSIYTSPIPSLSSIYIFMYEKITGCNLFIAPNAGARL